MDKNSANQEAYIRNDAGDLELVPVPSCVCEVRGCGRPLRFVGERYQANFGAVAWDWDCGAHRFMEVKNNKVLGHDVKVRLRD